MLNHLHYEIIIFLYTEDKQENITLMKDPDSSLPAPLPSIGINLTREIVLQQLKISEQSKVQSVVFDYGTSDPLGEQPQIWKVVLFRNFNPQHVTNLLLDSVFICSLGALAIFLLTLGRVIPSISVLYRSIFLKSDLISKSSYGSGSQSRDFCPLGDIWQCPETFLRGFSHGSVGRESACSAGDTGDVHWIPGLGRSPGEGRWQPTPVFLPEKSHGWRSLEDMTKDHHPRDTLDFQARGGGWGDAAGVWWIEARDSAEHPTKHKTNPLQPGIEEESSPKFQ